MGLVIANCLDYGMIFYSSSIQWRFPCAFQIAPCICVACLVPFLPESPRYLAKTGRLDLTINNLAALRGVHRDDPELQQEMKDIEYIVEVEQREEGTWSDVFKDGGVSGSTRVLIACVANALQQLTVCALSDERSSICAVTLVFDNSSTLENAVLAIVDVGRSTSSGTNASKIRGRIGADFDYGSTARGSCADEVKGTSSSPTGTTLPVQPNPVNTQQGYTVPQAPAYQRQPPKTSSRRKVAKNLGFLSMLAS
ncbi:unnamed protein product [Aureobasidium vineae]|uniref:Major facilitator superfamily (MFS) profile domain-containing protein n=1 Tax=Aureobasidium vineae TaxID=2773715 RepID=A0A9N8JXE1_9PEZI|nr:unnamed protein product [Aureobasidium vineae]